MPVGGGTGGACGPGGAPVCANTEIVDVSVRSEVLMKHPNILILPSSSDAHIGSSCLLAVIFHTPNCAWKERLIA